MVSSEKYAREQYNKALAKRGLPPLEREEPVGIPYAASYIVTTIDDAFVAFVVRCPTCGVYIEEHEMKDEESHTGSEYAQHQRRLH